MINYTVQHVLILRLLMSYEFDSQTTLQNLLFLATSETPGRHQLGFYDFIRRRSGAFSSAVHSILEELKREKLISRPGLSLSNKGREVYYSLAPSLLPFSDFGERCNDIAARCGDKVVLVNRAILLNLMFRRAKIGQRIKL